MKSYRKLWMVAVIAAWLGGCAAASKDADDEGGGTHNNKLASDDAARSTSFSSPALPDEISDHGSAGSMASGAAGKGGASGKGGSSSDPAGSSGAPPAEDGEAGDAASVGGSDNVQSGTLTAGAWDDNLNFDRFHEQRSALLQKGIAGALPTSDKEHADAHEQWSGARAAHQLLDIALVIDTTGSMGDEIAYLQTELVSISKTLEDRYPNAAQRWSFVVYRDEGDAYVTRPFAFTDDVAHLRADLAAQDADGGGDTPEAPDAALATMNDLDWRTGDQVARIAFWIADAPHHAENAEAMADAIRGSAALDVHVYPIASSGVDEFTELTMRSTAQLTGGRYLFLTDDSGVGGAHKEPSIPCYFVTRLDQAMLRMVDIELTGEYREPAEDEIIRTGGDPQDGACTLALGDEVEAF